jgi:hypothetical protein
LGSWELGVGSWQLKATSPCLPVSYWNSSYIYARHY